MMSKNGGSFSTRKSAQKIPNPRREVKPFLQNPEKRRPPPPPAPRSRASAPAPRAPSRLSRRKPAAAQDPKPPQAPLPRSARRGRNTPSTKRGSCIAGGGPPPPRKTRSPPSPPAPKRKARPKHPLHEARVLFCRRRAPPPREALRRSADLAGAQKGRPAISARASSSLMYILLLGKLLYFETVTS